MLYKVISFCLLLLKVVYHTRTMSFCAVVVEDCLSYLHSVVVYNGT